ncbi:MAG: hypothetical protein ACFE0O_07545 [Opitutales bacterium]
MISLAPFKYRRVTSDTGGPIDRIAYRDIEIFGKPAVQATAFLKPGLNSFPWDKQLYGNADGTGTHLSAQIARYMAVSESMERWAFYESHWSDRASTYGFDVDPTTNGMSAYPGVLARQARKKARMEAIERHAVTNWWEGLLPIQHFNTGLAGVYGFEIKHAFGNAAVVVLWHEFEIQGRVHYAYGFASDENRSGAVWKATIELDRNIHVLRNFHQADGSANLDQYTRLNDFTERRAVFFGSQEGFELFQDRMMQQPTGSPVEPEVLYDGEITGPWSNFATVWRVAFKPASQAYLDPNEMYFIF